MAQVFKGALDVFLAALKTTLMPRARANELQWQRRVHEKTTDSIPIDNPDQYTASDGSFKPNESQAGEYAKSRMRIGVGTRLEGAIACYKIGDQMECVRHIVLALGTIFKILNWHDACLWCDQQSEVLYALRKKKKTVA